MSGKHSELEALGARIDAAICVRSRRRLSGAEIAEIALRFLRDPTPKMEAAFYASCDEHGNVLWRYGYRAMIDAALAADSNPETTT